MCFLQVYEGEDERQSQAGTVWLEGDTTCAPRPQVEAIFIFGTLIDGAQEKGTGTLIILKAENTNLQAERMMLRHS